MGRCAGSEGFGAEDVGNSAGTRGADGFGGDFGFGGGGFADRDAVTEGDGAAGDGGDAGAGDEDADEVEGVSSGEDEGGFLISIGGFACAGGVLSAGLAEAVDDGGEGELLAEGAGDEAAAADLAASFETAEDGEEVAPLGGIGFADEEFAEEDAVAAEEYAGVGVECGVGAAGVVDGGLRSHPR